MTQNKTGFNPDWACKDDCIAAEAFKEHINARASLPKRVDVQGLKFVCNPPYKKDFQHGKAIGWNECIDHLIKKGIICDETSV